jgi:hypothetical protein
MTTDGANVASMVQKNLIHLQTDRKHNASEMLMAITPEIGKLVRKLVLEETDFTIDRAYELINEFKRTSLFSEYLFSLANERKKHIERLHQEHLRRILAEEEKFITNYNYDEDSCANKASNNRSYDNELPLKFKESANLNIFNKKTSKENRYNISKINDVSTHSPGKFGIIHESDINNMRPEFVQWAIEVKKSSCR